MRTTAAALLLAALTLAARADDPAADLSDLKAEMDRQLQAAAKGERAKLSLAFAPKLVAHAAKHPAHPSAGEAVVLALRAAPPGSEGPREEALKLLAGDVGKHLAVRRQFKAIADPFDEDGQAAVAGLARSHPDKTTRAWATHALSKAHEARARLAAEAEKDAASRERLERQLGKEAVRSLLARATNDRFRARQYRTKLNKDYPGVFPDLSLGKPAPELEAEDLDGKKVRLSDLKGKVVVLDFWATWCGPCRAMIPHERELVARLKGKPFALVSISADDGKATVKRFLEKTPMPWTHWHLGPRHEVLDTWEVEAFPTILVLDPKGVIRYKDVREKRMDEAIDNLLAEAE